MAKWIPQAALLFTMVGTIKITSPLVTEKLQLIHQHTLHADEFPCILFDWMDPKYCTREIYLQVL